MSDIFETRIIMSEALISSYKKTLERTDLDAIMRKCYEESIVAEQKYVDYLKSRRRPNTLAKD
jgi:hypothetical protein